LTVSSATLAAFSKPVIAKKASATPAMIARIGLPSPENSVSTPKSASPSATYQTPMIMITTRPATSTKVISMLTTTDSVMPMKFRIVRNSRKTSVMSRAGGRSQTSAKYAAKPDASEPEAAKLDDRNEIVIRNVSGLLRNALLT
jgi:hypothetical protein